MKIRIVNRKMTVLWILLLIVTMIFALSLYIGKLKETFFDIFSTNIENIALQQNKSINKSLELQKKNLEKIKKLENECINRKEIVNLDELKDDLNSKCKIFGFETLYLINDSGEIFSIINGKDEIDEKDIKSINKIIFNEEKTANGKTITSDDSKFVFFCTNANQNISNVKIKYIVGKVQSKEIYEKIDEIALKNNSFSVIFNKNGDFLISTANDRKSLAEYNFYKYLNESGKLLNENYNQIISYINQQDFFRFKFKNNSEETSVIYVFPLEKIDWYLMISVPFVFYSNISNRFVVLTIIIFVSVMIILVFLNVTTIYKSRKIIETNASASAKSEFLSVMSHEIRTPLSGIIGLNYLIKNHLDDKEKLKDLTVKMDNSSQYLLKLINDILDISKIQANKIDIENKPASLEFLLDGIYSMHMESMKKKHLKFTMDKRLVSACVKIDFIRLQQVLINIIGNAMKFTPSGGEVSVLVTQKEISINEVMTVITISDTGIGMSPEFIVKIFDSFSQDRNSNKLSQKGTGLGMFISKRLMNAMSGDITVKSELGYGSTFTVVFPAKICRYEDVIKETEKSCVVKSEKNLNILIAEDNEFNAEIVMEILKDAGIKATLAIDGKDVIDKFQNSELWEYNLILMDIQMPYFNGYEATKIIRNLDRIDAKVVKIFACTANNSKEDEIKAVDSGMDDFISKPIDIDKLNRKINNI